MANEIEKFIDKHCGDCLTISMRRDLRKLVKRAFVMRVSHEVVDPHYRTKDVLRAMSDEFKDTFGFNKPNQ